jgi:hypothetical protein
MRLDVEQTWPSRLIDLFSRNLPMLAAYEKERAAWDKRCEEDIMARLMPSSPNPHRLNRDEVLAECDAIVRDAELVGYHCTRLHDGEIGRVQREGLRPLSPGLFEERLADSVARGLLTADTAVRLRARNQVADSNRIGMVWFIFTENLLRQEWGVGRFFRSWGGEALYNLHEDDPETGAALAAIGKPCVVEAAVPAVEIETYDLVGERVLRAFLERRKIRTGHGSDMQGHTKVALSGDQVLRVIRSDDPEFERLTKCSRWNEVPSGAARGSQAGAAR